MIQGDKFIWLKKEVVAEHEFVNLPGFRSIINKKEQFGCEYYKIEIGCEYIHGKEPDTDMITEGHMYFSR
jgi:hypothetical protein